MMNITVNIEPYVLDKSLNFVRLIERLRRCIRERELSTEQQRRKIYSINHFIEHVKRAIQDNPFIARALFRFYQTIKNISAQKNQFSSTMSFDNDQSKMSFEENISIGHLGRMKEQNSSKSDLAKMSFPTPQSTKSITNLFDTSRQTNGLMTKTTYNAITKASHQRTTSDIEVLEHLLTRCESLRHLPVDVRHYAARSSFLLTYLPNTIITRQKDSPFLVYLIVSDQCHLLLKTNETTLLGPSLSIGDVYGDDSLYWIGRDRLNGLITSENNQCSLIGFFLRDIRAYENYFSDLMKQSLLEQLRSQSTFLAMQWRSDILDYFFKWATYRQYSFDQIIYGNEADEHENLYFILRGQVSFVRLLEFPTMAIKHPGFYRNMTRRKTDSNCHSHTHSQMLSSLNEKSTWRFLEIFVLSDGHYFGFESTSDHSWYLTRTTVDIISIPKIRFTELGSFARMIFEKLRQDFLDILPTELSIRQSYIQYLQMNQSESLPTNSQPFLSIKYKHHHHHLKKANWIPSPTILRMKFQNEIIKFKKMYSCS